MRQVVLDTETTGLNVEKGHRIIEIGCIELYERRRTGRRFHRYLNPEREIDAGALQVHGLDETFLRDKPKFAEIASEFLEFISDAELIIHNAAFDVAFLEAEFSLLSRADRFHDPDRILDTLALARQRFPGQKNSLDALCKRLGVDNAHRELHGALLDADLLCEVYLALTAGQGALELGLVAGFAQQDPAMQVVWADARRVKLWLAPPEEVQLHEKRLDALDRACKTGSIWRRMDAAAAEGAEAVPPSLVAAATNL